MQSPFTRRDAVALHLKVRAHAIVHAAPAPDAVLVDLDQHAEPFLQGSDLP